MSPIFYCGIFHFPLTPSAPPTRIECSLEVIFPGLLITGASVVQRMPEPDCLDSALGKLFMSYLLGSLWGSCEPIYATCLALCLTHFSAVSGFTIRILSSWGTCCFLLLALIPGPAPTVVWSAVTPLWPGVLMEMAQCMVSPAGFCRVICSHMGRCTAAPRMLPRSLQLKPSMPSMVSTSKVEALHSLLWPKLGITLWGTGP